jgi:hypothetical protein
MAISHITDFVIFGNAADTKPLAGTPTQSLFFEIDTGRVYKFTGGVWSLFSGDSKTETLSNKTLVTPSIDTLKANGGLATITMPSTTQTVVGRGSIDTLTNKTLIAPIMTSIYNGGAITLPSGIRTLVARDTLDTLLNKTININSNTLTATSQSLGDTLINNGTQYIRLAKGSTGQVLTSTATTVQWQSLSSASTTAVNVWSAQQTFNDTMLLLRNPANTFSMTLGSGAQTAAKTFTFPLISGSSDTISTNTSTSTLTNKTLTSPVISTIVNTGTLTLPTSTDTLMGRATTDTMTNKTFNYSNNTVTDTSAALGDIPKHDGTSFKRFARGTANQVLGVNSGGTDIAWTSFNAENTGTAVASGNGSTTSFNIAHSLAGTPYMAQVHCSSLSTAFTYTYNTTNIVVTFVTAPASATNNVTFQWRALL